MDGLIQTNNNNNNSDPWFYLILLVLGVWEGGITRGTFDEERRSVFTWQDDHILIILQKFIDLLLHMSHMNVWGNNRDRRTIMRLTVAVGKTSPQEWNRNWASIKKQISEKVNRRQTDRITGLEYPSSDKWVANPVASLITDLCSIPLRETIFVVSVL